jgi:hypothetical protein
MTEPREFESESERKDRLEAQAKADRDNRLQANSAGWDVERRAKEARAERDNRLHPDTFSKDAYSVDLRSVPVDEAETKTFVCTKHGDLVTASAKDYPLDNYRFQCPVSKDHIDYVASTRAISTPVATSLPTAHTRTDVPPPIPIPPPYVAPAPVPTPQRYVVTGPDKNPLDRG